MGCDDIASVDCYGIELKRSVHIACASRPWIFETMYDAAVLSLCIPRIVEAEAGAGGANCTVLPGGRSAHDYTVVK